MASTSSVAFLLARDRSKDILIYLNPSPPCSIIFEMSRFSLLFLSMLWVIPAASQPLVTASEVERWRAIGRRYWNTECPGNQRDCAAARRGRRLAEAWFLSAYQNRTSLMPLDLQLLTASLLGSVNRETGDDLKNFFFLSEVEREFGCGPKMKKKLQRSTSSDQAKDLERCANVEKFLGSSAYSLHSMPASRLGAQSASACLGLAAPPPMAEMNMPRCLKLAQERLEEAVSLFQQRLRVSEADKLHVETLISEIKLTLALVFHESGDGEEAKKLLSEVIRRTTDNPELEPLARLHLGRLLRDEDRRAEASSELERAAKAAKGSLQPLWLIETARGGLAHKSGDRPEAARLWRQALELQSRYREEAIRDANVFDLENVLMSFSNPNDILVSAISQAERSKEYDDLARSYFATTSGQGTVHLFNQWRAFRRPADDTLFQALSDAVQSNVTDWQPGKFLDPQRRGLSYQKAEVAAAKFVPVPFKAEPADKAWNMAWRKLGPSGALLLVTSNPSFSLSQKAVRAVGRPVYTAWLWRSSTSAPMILPLGDCATWDSKLRMLRAELDLDASGKASGAAAKLQSVMLDLHKRLAFPTTGEWKGVKLLAIAADGEFQQFPWASAGDYNNSPIGARMAVVQVAGLAEIATWNPGPNAPIRASFQAICPSLTALQPLLRQSTPELTQLASRLSWDTQECLDEARVIAPYIGPPQKTGTLRSAQGPYFVHVRSHGAVVDSAIDLPASDRFLLLLGAAEGAGSDGVLLASEARWLRLDNTRLVVLVACNTAQGVSLRGESAEGFPKAFRMAGARTVLSPMWLVNSKYSAKFLGDFYANLKRGAAEALRRAQETAKLKGVPFSFWAAWTVHGDPGPI